MRIENIISQLASRKSGIAEYLDQNAPYIFADQNHLDANTPAHSYWHLGYKTALADALNLLAEANAFPDNRDKSGGYSLGDRDE